MALGTWIWGAEAVASGLSLTVGRPWTAVLSRRSYDEAVQAHPLFREANLVITAGWTLYFGGAALTTAITAPWVGLALVGPTPLLGWCSFRIGRRYAPWRNGREMRKGVRAMTNVHPSQDELRAMIVGKSDEEILAFVHQAPGGVAGVLDATVGGMPDALDQETAVDCVVGYEIDAGEESFDYRIEVRGVQVEAARRAPSDARVVLQLSVPEYLRLITGLLDGTEAFLSGRMRIRGDVLFAPQIGRMFRTA